MFKAIFVAIAMFSVSAVAPASATVRITTGSPTGMYMPVYGVNLQSALVASPEWSKEGVVLLQSGGSIENFNRLAKGEAEIGFGQADAYMAWRKANPTLANSVRILSRLPGSECLFMVVAKDGLSKMSNLSADTNIATGAAGSGSSASWEYLTQLQPKYAGIPTIATSGPSTMSQLTTGEISGYFYTSPIANANEVHDVVLRSDGGMKYIDISDSKLNDKLPIGGNVYEFMDVVVDDRGWDVTVEVPCTSTLVAVNAKNSNELNDAVARILLKNSAAIVKVNNPIK